MKRFLEISAKNAVNAVLTNGALMAILGNYQHELRTRAGWLDIFHLTLACVVSREAIIWVPKLLAWSQSDSNGKAKGATA